MSATLLDVAAVRARFTALDRRLAFFDGPGGTQCPDEVIDAIAAYLRRDNANIGAPYETSERTTALVDHAHERAASFLGCAPGEVAFGQSMTALNFLLTRAFARTLAARRRGARHPARPRRERRALARDPARHRDHRPLRRRHRRPRARLRRSRAEALRQDARRRVPGRRELRGHRAGRQADGRPRPLGRRPRLGRRRPLRPARPDRRRGVGLRRPHLLPVQVLRPAHGDGVRTRGAAAQLAPVQGAPRRRRAGRATASSSARASTSSSPVSSPRSTTSTRSAGRRWSGTSASSGSASSTACPGHVTLHGLPTMEGRVPTFCFSVAASQRPLGRRAPAPRGRSPSGGATTTRSRRSGTSGSTSTTARCGPGSCTTTRPTRSTGCSPRSRSSVEAPPPRRPKFLGRAVIDAALARGHEVTLFNRGHDGSPTSIRSSSGSRATGTAGSTACAAASGTRSSTRPGTCRGSSGRAPSSSTASVPHYVFVSSISVYASFAEVVDESGAGGRALGARLRERRAGLRGAQGALRGGRRGGVPRTLDRPSAPA